MLDGSTEVPVAARVLATWPADGSVRALLLQFDAPVAKTYTIQTGAPRSIPDRAFVPVTWDVPTRLFTLAPAYLSDSLIFWEQTPLGQSGFPAWDQKQLNAYSRIATVGTAACARDDHYYDAITTTYQLYARTGNSRTSSPQDVGPFTIAGIRSTCPEQTSGTHAARAAISTIRVTRSRKG